MEHQTVSEKHSLCLPICYYHSGNKGRRVCMLARVFSSRTCIRRQLRILSLGGDLSMHKETWWHIPALILLENFSQITDLAPGGDGYISNALTFRKTVSGVLT